MVMWVAHVIVAASNDPPSWMCTREDTLWATPWVSTGAFQTDSTRISTLLLAHDGSNRSFKDIGVSDGHHSLSHHQLDPVKVAKIEKIDLFYMRQFAYYMERMKSLKDADGSSMLDNSMVVYCAGLSDGNRHRHDDLPVIVAGHAGGSFNPGRHVKLGGNTPMSNLYVRMLH